MGDAFNILPIYLKKIINTIANSLSLEITKTSARSIQRAF